MSRQITIDSCGPVCPFYQTESDILSSSCSASGRMEWLTRVVASTPPFPSFCPLPPAPAKVSIVRDEARAEWQEIEERNEDLDEFIEWLKARGIEVTE